MKIQILSDIHLEFERKYDGYKSDSDVIVLAGDIDTHNNIITSLQRFQQIYNKPIIFVPGNHEYYNTSKMEMDLIFEALYTNNIYILNNDYVKIGDVMFIGSTGWWDESNGTVYPYVRNMSDYHYISDLIEHNNGIDWGVKSKFFFENALGIFKKEKTVCISHNGPINLPNEKYKGSALNTCFFNHWPDLLEKYSPNLWIHGHTHDSIDKQIFDTKLICNPKGYIDENKNFNPSLTIDL